MLLERDGAASGHDVLWRRVRPIANLNTIHCHANTRAHGKDFHLHPQSKQAFFRESLGLRLHQFRPVPAWPLHGLFAQSDCQDCVIALQPPRTALLRGTVLAFVDSYYILIVRERTRFHPCRAMYCEATITTKQFAALSDIAWQGWHAFEQLGRTAR